EYGIAAYKVTGDIAQAELAYILAVGGITIEYGKALGRDISLAGLRADYDAVFLGLGLGGTNGLGLGDVPAGVSDAVAFIAALRQAPDKTVLPIVEGVTTVFGVRTPRNEYFTAVICWVAIGLLWFLVNRTRRGKAVMAASMNPRGVTLLGIELSSIYLTVWAIYGLLAGVAGILLGMFLGVSSYSVGPLTASAFSIVVLGGLGSVSGSLIAAYVVGYLETGTAYLISPAYRTIPALLLLVVVMYLRPQGLFGRR
ncbi:MAG: hypothetical protein E6447_24780, partial [Bradyrhizobium sp.]|nr:hypothetical protein [Bradyrhizobium sp.]